MARKRRRKPPTGARQTRSASRRWLPTVFAVLGVVGVVGFLVVRRGGEERTSEEAMNAEAQGAAIRTNVAAAFGLEDQERVFSRYGGSASCRECHEEAYELWETSNHGMAERLVSEVMDRGAFSPSRAFRHGTQRTEVSWVDGSGEVITPGLSGSEEVHRVDRVIGHRPLRQFLVPFPGGRWQTLEASYDPVTNAWFNVYGEEDRRPGEWGHWTGRGMNWNVMCAGCHNTRLRKNYDEATDSYQTAMAEMTVGCEACHGPLEAHNQWQRLHGKSGMEDPTVSRLDRDRVLQYCGFCHARRTDLTGDFKPGDAFFDHQDLVITDRTDRYYPDGQVRDEDYEFASLLSSRMHFRGVMCLDCHDPHSARTRLPGNWLCIRCHNGSYTNAPVIEPVSHSHHKVYGFDTNGVPFAFDLEQYDPRRIEETGGECVNCHMPQTVYMGNHWRHDHAFTIPDPLLTKQHDIPNACNRCHQDKTVEWALEACEQWYSNRMDRVTRTRAQWLARARQDDPAAVEPLLKMVAQEELGYWRAAALGHLEPWLYEPRVRAALLEAIQDEDPLVRSKAVRAVEPLLESRAGATVSNALRRALDDPVRAVRIQAAWSSRAELDLAHAAAGELMHYLNLNADQPGGQMQKGAWYLSRGDTARAATHYAKAVSWDPNSAPIRHDYAVVLSTLGRTREAVGQLEDACRLAPKEAEYLYKLGLALNEIGELDRTITALKDALRLSPTHARAGYNLGLALNTVGRVDEALVALEQAETADRADPRIPYARATILANAGRVEEAREAAARAVNLAPEWGEPQRLLQVLGGRL